MAEPLTAEGIEYWRRQLVSRDVDEAHPWPDSKVIDLVARWLATLDAARAASPDRAGLRAETMFIQQEAVMALGPKNRTAVVAAFQSVAALLDSDKQEGLDVELRRLAAELDRNADWRGDRAKVAVAAMQSVAGSLHALAARLKEASEPVRSEE